MKSVLVILAHANFDQSKINKTLINGVKELGDVKIHDIYQTYPDGVIDIAKEQALISQADVLVFQHPFYWYSAPALLKEWFDLVLQFNFAYGPKGDVLKNKQWLSVITTGGPQEAYGDSGHNRFSMRQFLTPYDQTANLCQMEFLPPYIVHGARSLAEDPASLTQKVGHYQRLLSELVNDELEDFSSYELMNQRWEKN